MEEQPIRFLITGGRGAGKTTLCAGLAQAARAAGWQVRGLLSHAVFEGDIRAQINVEDLSSGENRALAMRSNIPTPGSRHWQFDPAAVAWGNSVLQRSLPCDLLIVDELGPLEFEQEQGWQAAFPALDSAQYEIAVVVVRAELLPHALLRWDNLEIVEVDTAEDAQRKLARLAADLFA